MSPIQIGFRFRLFIVVDNAEKDRREACETLVFYGIGDNIVPASLKMITGGRLLGEDSRSNPAGIGFKVAMNGGAIFIWFVSIAADHPGASVGTQHNFLIKTISLHNK